MHESRIFQCNHLHKNLWHEIYMITNGHFAISFVVCWSYFSRDNHSITDLLKSTCLNIQGSQSDTCSQLVGAYLLVEKGLLQEIQSYLLGNPYLSYQCSCVNISSLFSVHLFKCSFYGPICVTFYVVKQGS